MLGLLAVSIALLAIAPLVLIYDAWRHDRDPFEPGLWIPVLMFFIYGVATLQRILQQDFSLVGDYAGGSKQGDILTVLWLALAGQLAFATGYHLDLGRTAVSGLPSPPDQWDSERAWVLIAVFVALGLVGYIGVSGMIGSGPRTQIVKGSSMYLFILTTLLNAGVILILADVGMRSVDITGWTIEISQPVKAMIGVVTLVATSALLLSLGGRGRAFQTFVVGAFLFHYFVRRFSLLEAGVLYLVTQAMPAWTARIAVNMLTFNFGEVLTTLRHPHFLRYSPTLPLNNIVVLVAGMPEKLPFQYGRTFASALFAGVPYQPIPQTHTVYNNAFLGGATDYGVQITLVGELYMNFHLIGVLVGMGLAGIIIRGFYEYTIVQSDARVLVVIFAVTLNFRAIISGNFSNSFPKLGLKLLPLIGAALIISGAIYHFLPGHPVPADENVR